MFKVINKELNTNKDMALYFDMVNRHVGVCPRDHERDSGFVLFFDLNGRPSYLDICHVIGDLADEMESVFEAKVVYSKNFTKLHLREGTLSLMQYIHNCLNSCSED